MVHLGIRRSTCPACGGPNGAAALCADCTDAFALAERPLAPAVDHDLDIWDEWSLLGDVGIHRAT